MQLGSPGTLKVTGYGMERAGARGQVPQDEQGLGWPDLCK